MSDLTEDDLPPQRRELLRRAREHGMSVGMVPSQNEDRCEPGIDWDRSKWSTEARERLGGLEALLAVRYPTQRAEVVEAAAFQVDLTPVESVPASWWQQVKLALQTRWPRALGWLTVRWRR